MAVVASRYQTGGKRETPGGLLSAFFVNWCVATISQRKSAPDIQQTILDLEPTSKRVAMRVNQGGHDVPDEKLRARFERTQANLKRAIERLPQVIVYSNDDLRRQDGPASPLPNL